MGKIRDKSQELVNNAIPHVLSAQQGAINLVHLKRNVEMMTASLDLQIARKAYVNTHILVSESVFAKSDYLQKKGTSILQDVNRLWKLRLQLDELRSTVNSSLNYMDALMYLVYNEQPMLFPELDSHVNNYTDLYKQTGNIRDLKSQHEFYYRLMLERLSEDFDREGFLKAQLKLRQSKMQSVSPNSKKIVGNVVDDDTSLVSANSRSLAGVRAQTDFIDSNTKAITARNKVMNQYYSGGSAVDSQVADNAATLATSTDNVGFDTEKNTADLVTNNQRTDLNAGNNAVATNEYSNRNQLNDDESFASANMDDDVSKIGNSSSDQRADGIVKDPMLLSVLDKDGFEGVLSEDYQQKVITDLHNNPYIQDNDSQKKNVDTINASLESHRDTLDGHNIFVGNNEFTVSQGKDLIEDGEIEDDAILEIEHVQERHTGPIFFKSREHDLKLLSLYKSELDRFDTLWSLFTKLQTVFSYDTNNLSNEIDALSHSFTSGETAILHGELSDISQLAAQIKPMVMMTVGFSLVGFWIVIFLLNRFIIRPLKNIARILIVFRRTKRVNIKQNESFFAQEHVMEIREIIDILPQLFDEFSSIEKKSSDLDQRYKQLLASSKYDALTKVLNRGTLNLLVKSMGADTPANFAVLMVDIDYFKNLNDTMGHQRGDEVLFAVAQTLQNNLAKKDFVFRYGGEEFCIVLSEISPSNAYKVAERLCATIRKLALINNGVPCGLVTVSIGISLVTQSNSQFRVDELISQADKALYLAKRNGRNQAVACPKAMVFAMNDDDGTAEGHNNQGAAAEANPNAEANTLAEDVTHGRASAPLKALASLTNEARAAQSTSSQNGLSTAQVNSKSESTSIPEVSASNSGVNTLQGEASTSNIEKSGLQTNQGSELAEVNATALNNGGTALTNAALDNGANAQNYLNTDNGAGSEPLNSQSVIQEQVQLSTQAQSQVLPQGQSQDAPLEKSNQDSKSELEASEHTVDANANTKLAHKGMLSKLRSVIEHDVAHSRFKHHQADLESQNAERQIESESGAEQSLENATLEGKVAYRVDKSPSMISLDPFDRYDRRHRQQWQEHNHDVNQHKTAVDGVQGDEQASKLQLHTAQLNQQVQPSQQTQLNQQYVDSKVSDSLTLDQSAVNAQDGALSAAQQSNIGNVASYESSVPASAHVNEVTAHVNVATPHTNTIVSAQSNTAIINGVNANTNVNADMSNTDAVSIGAADVVNSANTANLATVSGQNAPLATHVRGETVNPVLSSSADLHSQTSSLPEQENQEYELVITTDEAGNSHEYFIGEDEGPIDLTKLNAEQSKHPAENLKAQNKFKTQEHTEYTQVNTSDVKQAPPVALMISTQGETPKKVASKSLGTELEDIVLPQSNDLSQVVIDRNLVAVMAAANPERGLTEDPLTSDRSIIDMRSGPIVLPCLFDCETFFPGYVIDEDQFDSPHAVYTQQESEYLIDIRLNNNNDYATSPFLLKEDPTERERSHDEVEHWSLATLFNLFKSYTHKRDDNKQKTVEGEDSEQENYEQNLAKQTAGEHESGEQLNAAQSQQVSEEQLSHNAQVQNSNEAQSHKTEQLTFANQVEQRAQQEVAAAESLAQGAVEHYSSSQSSVKDSTYTDGNDVGNVMNKSVENTAVSTVEKAAQDASALNEDVLNIAQLVEATTDSTNEQEKLQSSVQSLHQVVDQAVEQEVEKSMREAQASALQDGISNRAGFNNHSVFSEENELLDDSGADNSNVVLQTMKNIVSTPNDELFSKIDQASHTSSKAHSAEESGANIPESDK